MQGLFIGMDQKLALFKQANGLLLITMGYQCLPRAQLYLYGAGERFMLQAQQS